MAASRPYTSAIRLRAHRRTSWLGVVAAVVAACSGGEPGAARDPEPKVAPFELSSEPDGEAELGAAGRERERPATKPVHSVAEARAAVISGNPEGACTFLAGHVDDHPGELNARLLLARARVATGDYDEALVTLADPRGAPESAAARLERARIHVQRGQSERAETLLAAVLREHPQSFAARGQLLTLMVETGRGEESRARELMESLYDAYDAGQAKSAEALLAVAQAALARGSTGAFQDANDVLDEAERAAPVAQGSWLADRIILARGAMFLEKYAGADAAQTYSLLLQRDPWNPDALVGVAHVHADGLRFAPAARAAREALKVNPRHPDAHAVLARIALIEGRRDEARELVRDHVFAVDPGHTEGLAVLAALAKLERDEGGYDKWRARALSRNPKDARFFAGLADILGFLHLYPEIDEVLAEGVKLAPRNPRINSALGLNLLRLGQEQRGREALERAWKRDRFNARTRNLLELYEKSIDQSYSTLEGQGLWLRLPTKDSEIMGQGLVAAVERARTALDRRYGTKAGALRLEFFGSPEEFSVRTTGVSNFGATAVCFGRLITFVGPFRGTHNIDQVIWHELAHVYAVTRSRGRVPRWFTEGLSEWETELADPAWARESAELLMSARRQGKLRRLGELELAFIRAESPAMMEVAYSTAAYAIRYLGETYGLPRLIAMLDGYGRGRATDELVRKHLGKELATIEREFETWLDARLDERVNGWEPGPTTDAKADERDTLFARAKKQVGRRQLAEAKATLERLIASGGDGYGPRMLLARVLLAGKKPGDARPHLEQAHAFHREAVEPPAVLAELAARRGRADDEKLHLTHALNIDAHAFAPAARLLMLSIVTDDSGAQRLALGRTRAIAPLHPMVLSARALLLARGGSAKEARTLIDRALAELERGPGATDTLVVAALAMHAVGDRSTAEILATRARQDDALPAVASKALEGIGGSPTP